MRNLNLSHGALLSRGDLPRRTIEGDADYVTVAAAPIRHAPPERPQFAPALGPFFRKLEREQVAARLVVSGGKNFCGRP
jgi:hypothetical protein